MRARRLVIWFGAWMALLATAYFLFSALNLVLWSAISMSSAVAVAVGTFYHRPRRTLPWLLICAAVFVFAAGDITYLVLAEVYGQDNPFPSAADACYLAMYPLLAAGLLLMPRNATGRDWAGLVDSLILAAGLLLLTWVVLIGRSVAPDAGTALISTAYPVGDVLLVATAAKLLNAVRRTPTMMLLTLGSLALLGSDILYGLSQLNANWSMGGPVDVGWIVFYLAWGAAALDPSMTNLTEPRMLRDAQVTPLRMVALALSALAAPTALMVEAAHGKKDNTVPDAQIIAIFSAVLFLLVLLRLAGLVRVHGEAVARERGLREAGAALVAAGDNAAVSDAVRVAVAHLLPPETPHEVVLDVGQGTPGREHAPTPRAELVRTSSLEPWLAEELANYEVALVTPLGLEEPVAGEAPAGTLVVAAAEPILDTLQASVEVLASQAALAIERITLNHEIARRYSEEYFRTMVHNTADVILIVTGDNRIRYASPSAAAVFGTSELIGCAVPDLVDSAHRELATQVLELFRGGRSGSGIADWPVQRADGDIVEVEVSGRDLRRDPTVRGLVLTLRDVTDRRRLERELRHQAFHDSLTGLANRVLFAECVRKAVTRVDRTGAIAGVLFLDLDDFKFVNDTMGHHVGDQLLTVVAHRLGSMLRASDTAARLGGDEFAVLIEDKRDPKEVELVAERIVRGLAEPVVLDGSLVTTSVSVGIATTQDATECADLLRQADLALYVAKGEGKGRWQRYRAELHTALVARLELRTMLDKAVADGAFLLQYQPIVALDGGATAGFEALIRWRHPDRGILAPGEFIDVAEQSGLIVPIGGWVLRQALADAARWISASDSGPAYVSVNVSARQFRNPGFIDEIQQELAASGLAPQRLMLEITESLLLRDDERVWTDLALLRKHGIRVAIDDFGTGYSSLSYLRQLSIDVVKIDRSFIETMSTSPHQRALVEGIVHLAHTLGLQVVAEGIARRADLDLLAGIGCPLGQGYFFSKPLDDGDVAGWLRASPVS